MAELKLEIIAPSKIVFNDTIQSVTIPGTKGQFQVLINHAPLISTFELGYIKVDNGTKSPLFFATSGGTVEVLNNNVKILADSLEALADIDVERAKRAKTRAEERLAKKHEEQIDVERAEAALKRAVNRIDLVEKYLRGDVVK